MGSTKAQIETVVTTKLASASDITAIDHRDVIKDNANSLLDNSYATELNDTQATETYLQLTTPASANFDINIVKQGRAVTITGSITSLVAALVIVGDLDTTTYPYLAATTGNSYSGFGKVPLGNPIQVTVSESGGVTTFKISEALLLNQTLKFNITYNVNA